MCTPRHQGARWSGLIHPQSFCKASRPHALQRAFESAWSILYEVRLHPPADSFSTYQSLRQLNGSDLELRIKCMPERNLRIQGSYRQHLPIRCPCQGKGIMCMGQDLRPATSAAYHRWILLQKECRLPFSLSPLGFKSSQASQIWLTSPFSQDHLLRSTCLRGVERPPHNNVLKLGSLHGLSYTAT